MYLKIFFIINCLCIANHEKLFLYILIGVLIAIVYILSMLVIKQYIHRRNIYRKIARPDLHEYEQPQQKLPSTNKTTRQVENLPPAPEIKTTLHSGKSINNNKFAKTNSTVSLNHKATPTKNQNSSSSAKITQPSLVTANSSRISKSSNNIFNDTSADVTTHLTPIQLIPHNNQKSNYEKLNNNFNPNFVNSHSAFTNHHSQSNLYNYNQNDLDRFDNFEGFKLITRNGSTKIVNGQNDDISEYEIPIIRYNDRSMQQQYMN